MPTVNPEVLQMLRSAAQTYGVPEGLFLGMIEGESGFNPNAVSPTGAKGLGQMFPAAMKDVQSRYGIHGDVFNPNDNANMAAAYLKMMLDQNKNDVVSALGSYNQGYSGFRNPKTRKLGLDYAKYILGKAGKYGFSGGEDVRLDNLYRPRNKLSTAVNNSYAPSIEMFTAENDSQPQTSNQEERFDLKDPISDLIVRGSVVDEVINRIFT